MTLHVRPARPGDLPDVVELVAGMFRELGAVDPPAGWAEAAHRALGERMGDDVAVYVTVDSSDRPVAAVVGVIDRHLPSTRRPDGRAGYVEWVVTDPAHRRRGAARMALAELLDWFDRDGIGVVDLHASEEAVPLYAALGFSAPVSTPLRRRPPADAPTGRPSSTRP